MIIKQHTQTFKFIFSVLLVILISAAFSCLGDPLSGRVLRNPQVELFFNNPGRTNQFGEDPYMDNRMAELIDNANYSIDLCVMGFNREIIYKAIIRAHNRGVKVRFVGDLAHFNEEGYKAIRDVKTLPWRVGNAAHIMHNKFFVIDQRLCFISGANFTDSGILRNNNNGILLESAKLAEVMIHEFNKFWDGAFERSKPIVLGYDDQPENHFIYLKMIDINNPNAPYLYDPNDPLNYKNPITQKPFMIEIWFTPYAWENGSGNQSAALLANKDYLDVTKILTSRMLASKYSLDFSVFAYTRDEVFLAMETLDNRPNYRVWGIFDESQTLSNRYWTEAYRMAQRMGPTNLDYDVRIDGNYHTDIPYEVSRSGGRYHAKTMLMDALDLSIPEHFAIASTDGAWDPMVVTGSFNWSISATRYNDETFLIIHDYSVAREFKKNFDVHFTNATKMNRSTFQPRDIVIDQILYAGSVQNSGNQLTTDTNHRDSWDVFIDLKNTTNEEKYLGFFRLDSGASDIYLFQYGSYIKPGDYLHIPRYGNRAFTRPDLLSDVSDASLIFMWPDPTFLPGRSRYIVDYNGTTNYIKLQDDLGNLIDQAGVSGTQFTAFFGPQLTGAPGSYVVHSSIRKYDANGKALPGDDPNSWEIYSGAMGNEFINSNYRQFTIANPRPSTRLSASNDPSNP